MFALPWYTYDPDAAVPEDCGDQPAAEFRRLAKKADQRRQMLRWTAAYLGVPVLLGSERIHSAPAGWNASTRRST